MISTDLDAARRDALVAVCEASQAERESGSRMRTARLDFVDRCDEATVLALLRALTAAEARFCEAHGEAGERESCPCCVAVRLEGERDHWHSIASRGVDADTAKRHLDEVTAERDAALREAYGDHMRAPTWAELENLQAERDAARDDAQSRYALVEAVFSALTKSGVAGLRQERDAARAEATRLHKLVDLAYNCIDPDEHPAWVKQAGDEMVKCDETIDALKTENAHLRTRVAAAVELREAAREVARISDRRHDAWIRYYTAADAFDATATDVGPYHGDSNKNSKEE